MNAFAKESHLQKSAEYIRSFSHRIPATAVVLGSGLGYFAEALQSSIVLSSRAIPHFPSPTVPGHDGRLIFGQVNGTEVIAIQGRSHYYEGKSLAEVTYYVQLLARLGIRNLILTNAAGGINPVLKPGDLVLLNDFINFSQINVLPQNRYPQLFFSQKLSQIARRSAARTGITLYEGCYCWTSGPSYETHAEVAIMQELGGDVVGMSTVPELIMGAYLRLNMLGISLVTNLAAGLSPTPLTHTEVQTAADEIRESYSSYMMNLITAIGTDET